MTNLQEIIDLCKDGQGKVFVLDASGNISLVLLSIDEYKRLINLPQKKTVDPELVNKQILRAQLEDDVPPVAPEVPVPKVLVKEAHHTVIPPGDMREEVIDPSFDFDSVDDI